MPNINLNMIFTEAAVERLDGVKFSFKGPPNLQTVPARGDVVIFPGLKSFSFVVAGRQWEYFDNQDLTITFLLDLLSKDDQRAQLSVVSQARAPAESEKE